MKCVVANMQYHFMFEESGWWGGEGSTPPLNTISEVVTDNAHFKYES